MPLKRTKGYWLSSELTNVLPFFTQEAKIASIPIGNENERDIIHETKCAPITRLTQSKEEERERHDLGTLAHKMQSIIPLLDPIPERNQRLLIDNKDFRIEQVVGIPEGQPIAYFLYLENDIG